MDSHITHELYIGEHPISILQSEEGEIYAQFDHPKPTPEKEECLLAYLHYEGFLPTDQDVWTDKNQETMSPKIVVSLTDGTKEMFSLTYSEVLSYDPDAHEVVIATLGKIITLENVARIETQG